MDVRDAVEADARALAALADAPADVMRNLVHDRTVRVAVAGDGPVTAGTDGADADATARADDDGTAGDDTDDDGTAGDDTDDDAGGSPSDRPLAGFVSFDASEECVHVTQLAGTREACERLLAEPVRFGRNERLPVECLIPEDDAVVRAAVEAVGFAEDGSGPRFAGRRTVRYRLEPAPDADGR
jgi:hypothetical protein